MRIFDAIGYLIPADYREQCLGDLYEGYFLLRERGRSKVVSVIITVWRALCLIWAALKMRLEDSFSNKRGEYPYARNKSIFSISLLSANSVVTVCVSSMALTLISSIILISLLSPIVRSRNGERLPSETSGSFIK